MAEEAQAILDSDETRPVQVKQIEAALPSRSAAVHEVIRRDGEKEMNRDSMALFWSAIAAGLTMCTSVIGYAALKAYLPDIPVFFPIIAAGYTIGFMLVIMANQQLFTENTITPVLPFMSNPSWSQLWRLLRLWGVVFLGNIIGGVISAWCLARLPLVNDTIASSLYWVGEHMMSNSPMEMLLKGIVSGWLIATLVWIIKGNENGKVFMILLVTWLISVGGFTHIVAGSIEAAYLVFKGGLSVTTAVFSFALPVLLGNILGGTFIFALISHAQIRSDLSED